MNPIHAQSCTAPCNPIKIISGMKRRGFIGTSGALAFSAILPGCSAGGTPERVSDRKEKQKKMTISTIAGLTVRELLENYRSYLYDDFLPFMDKHVVDHERGGFMTHADRRGNLLSTTKRAWYDGRGLWVYSFLYNNLGNDPSHLEIARKTTELLLGMRPADGEFWPWSYTREGQPITGTLPDIYGNLFIAEGVAEFSKATGDQKYYDISKEIVISCFNLYDRADYLHAVTYGPDADQLTGPRILGHWMVFLKVATTLLCVKEDPAIENIADRCIDALMNKHYMPEFDLMIEVLNHDMTVPEGPFAQFCYAGHIIEVLWMVMDEALRRKDKGLYDLAVKRLKRHTEVAWDDVYGGLFRCLENIDLNIWQVDKVLWEQAELLIGTMNMIEHTADPWAFCWFEKTYNYVMENYPLKKHGFPLWNFSGDRKMTFVEEYERIENYHHPRHLMLNILSLERILKNGNRPLFPGNKDSIDT